MYIEGRGVREGGGGRERGRERGKGEREGGEKIREERENGRGKA